MLVENIMPRARERLALIDMSASIADAAQRMAVRESDILIVCNGAAIAGVITKTDIIKLVNNGRPDFSAPLDAIMTRDLITCRVSDVLVDVWSAMSDHRFQRVPVLGDDLRPIGVVYARDALQALLRDAEYEDQVLRAYVQGVGYH